MRTMRCAACALSAAAIILAGCDRSDDETERGRSVVLTDNLQSAGAGLYEKLDERDIRERVSAIVVIKHRIERRRETARKFRKERRKRTRSKRAAR